MENKEKIKIRIKNVYKIEFLSESNEYLCGYSATYFWFINFVVLVLFIKWYNAYWNWDNGFLCDNRCFIVVYWFVFFDRQFNSCKEL